MTQRLAIFGATFFELKPFLKKFSIYKKTYPKKVPLFEAEWRGLSLVFVRTGVGKKQAAKAAEVCLREVQPDFGIVIGLCGGVVSSLKLGDLVYPKEVVDFSSGKKIALDGIASNRKQEGVLLSVDKVYGPQEKKKALEKYPNALACDMETSVIAEVLQKNKIPVSVIRAVSDTWNWHFPSQKVLLEKKWSRQMYLLFNETKWLFPLELARLILLGCNAKCAVLKNRVFFLRFLSFFVDTTSK